MKIFKIKHILRAWYYGRKLCKIFVNYGENVSVDFSNSYFSLKTIKLGSNVFIGSHAYISAELDVGNNVMFGPHCTIIGGDHLFGVLGKSVRFLKPKNKENEKKIVICDEVWCGANVIINKGVKIGMGAVIGSASCVVKSIPPYTVAVGNPCMPKKKIFTDKELFTHLSLLGYKSSIIDKIIKQRNDMLNLKV